MNMDYSQFYRGTTNIPSYGSGTYRKDTLVKYEFNTIDEKGNKVMDRMTKEETIKAMNDISRQYGDNVIVEFSGDGMAALADFKKGALDGTKSKEEIEKMNAKNAEFQKEIKHYNKVIDGEDLDDIMGRGSYLGHGNDRVYVTDTVRVMQTMDPEAYEEYQKIDRNADGGLSALKYLTNWHVNAAEKKASLIDTYEKQMEK
ncbi:MAG: hypothetical protein HFI37_06945 [Lachnospiraceae bacterium]|nr:hypothetical protein [Lachnospiraceae bacterium]